MNRLVLIGNGFDLAHGLPTSYKDFIDWYLKKRVQGFHGLLKTISEDCLCTFEDKQRRVWNVNACSGISLATGYNINNFTSGLEVYQYLSEDYDNYAVRPSELFKRIIQGVESKTWAGIEQDYYDILKEYAFRDKKVNPVDPPIKALNQQLRFVQEKLVEYLKEVSKQKVEAIPCIKEAIYSPLEENDISISGMQYYISHRAKWDSQRNNDLIGKKIGRLGLDYDSWMKQVTDYQSALHKSLFSYPAAFLVPDDILLLNFNYTSTVHLYASSHNPGMENYIHGSLSDTKSIIFGYGDELDEKFKELKEHKNNACLSHIKSICYLNAPNYRNVLSFIESEPFQVLIMGHSCGNSDRTLLNTIFEHPNCVSIKPYYYEKEDGTDNYTELVQHISRNFNDMKLMRARVVNKTQCKPLVEKNKTK